jgi:hypothetical protein
MKVKRALTFLTALLSSSGAPGLLQAQEGAFPYPISSKIRAGSYAGDIQKARYDNKIMAFGLEVRKSMFGGGRYLSAELAFEYVPGRHHDVMVPDHGVPGGLGLDPYWSYDDRKEWGQGWTFRASYYAPLPSFGPEIVSNVTKKMEWFAGLGIDRHKASSEFKWTLRDSSSYPLNTGTPTPPLYENGGSGAFTENGSDFTIGAFAGLKYRINNDFDFEIGLRNFGMKHWDFTPGTYLKFPDAPKGTYVGASAGKLEVGSTRGWALEFAIAVKL